MSSTTGFTWVDYFIVVVLIFSVLYAIWRGVIREAIALAGWILAILSVRLWGGDLAASLPLSWAPAVRTAVAYAGIFIGVMLLAGLIGWVLSRAVRAIGLGFMDRLLGAVFGLVRGVVIVLVAVAIAVHTPLKNANAWESAVTLPFFVSSLEFLEPWLPGGRLPLQLSAIAVAGSGLAALE
jgi:membrane protein required for colicin V production